MTIDRDIFTKIKIGKKNVEDIKCVTASAMYKAIHSLHSSTKLKIT